MTGLPVASEFDGDMPIYLLPHNRNSILITYLINIIIEFKDSDFLDSNKGFKMFSLILLGMFCDISSSCGCLKRTHKPFLQKVHLPPYLSDTVGTAAQ